MVIGGWGPAKYKKNKKFVSSEFGLYRMDIMYSPIFGSHFLEKTGLFIN
jgi:hypothetical protein